MAPCFGFAWNGNPILFARHNKHVTKSQKVLINGTKITVWLFEDSICISFIFGEKKCLHGPN